MALKFNGSSGSSVVCGNYNTGATNNIIAPDQAATTPIPVAIDWDEESSSIEAIKVHFAEYNGIDAATLCIRDNNCP